MTHAIAELMAERIASGLKRKSITSCARWASAYRVMGGASYPGPWRFTHHPWLRAMHDSTAEMNVGQKSAQMGYTETVLNVTFYNIDRGVDCLYVLPSQRPDAEQFSASRFDPALSLSPHLGKMFSEVNNVGHKRAGNTNLFIRGSKSRSQLKSIPVGLVVCDEVEEFDQENIPLVFERQSGQLFKQTWMLSTPRIAGSGINKYFQLSSQESYFFKCPRCGRLTTLVFPECMEIVGSEHDDPRIGESYLKCKECSGKLDHDMKPEWLADGTWVPEHADRMDYRGFYVNQLYSTTVKPLELARAWFLAQRNPADEQEFYNSKLGLDHVVAGASVTDKDIADCIKTHKKIPFEVGLSAPRGLVTMGVDPGRWLHYEIARWTLPQVRYAVDINYEATPHVIAEGKVLHFEDLDRLMRFYNVIACVIDAFPDRRKAFEFASRYWRRVKLCFYGQGVQGKQIQLGKEEEATITVDRTSWLDLSLGRFKNRMICLPIDVSEEYKRHIKALVRVYEKSKDGQDISHYRCGNSDDHLAHARNYNEIALQFALKMGQSQEIKGSVL